MTLNKMKNSVYIPKLKYCQKHLKFALGLVDPSSNLDFLYPQSSFLPLCLPGEKSQLFRGFQI